MATDPLAGVATNFDWNDAGQLAAIGYGTTPAATGTYTYDAATMTHSYDRCGRLASARVALVLLPHRGGGVERHRRISPG